MRCPWELTAFRRKQRIIFTSEDKVYPQYQKPETDKVIAGEGLGFERHNCDDCKYSEDN